MRIYEPNRPGMVHAYQKSGASQPLKGTRRPMGKDEVSISSEALELLKRGEEADTDSARLERLDELKRQIEQGTYHIPSDKLAEKLLAFWKKSQQ